MLFSYIQTQIFMSFEFSYNINIKSTKIDFNIFFTLIEEFIPNIRIGIDVDCLLAVMQVYMLIKTPFASKFDRN